MKVHVAIGQYEFVEAEATDPTEARVLYDLIKHEFSSGAGIGAKEMNAVVDAMLRGESIRNGVELWGLMSPEQQEICQTIKRANKRINGKLKNNE